MDNKRIAIAIDGPASAGKSTLAKSVAKKLGIIYVDTGAMYRAVGLKTIRLNIKSTDRESVMAMLATTVVSIRFVDGQQRVFLDGEDVSDIIRTQLVSNAASEVSTIPEVRIKLVELQRELAAHNSVVMDGRDIGINVLPNANFKFFITASVEERAKRRFKELSSRGQLGGMTFENLLNEILERDERDSTREFVPLRKAEDAILIDTTNISAEKTTEIVIQHIGG